MAENGKPLDQQLNELIRSLKDQGILDDYFDQLKGLQDENDPRFVEDLITSTFLPDAEDNIAELTTNLSEDDVKYTRVEALARRLKHSSASLGGGRLSQACKALQVAGAANDKEECRRLFDNVKSEYQVLEENLNRIVEIEREIYETKLSGNSP